MQNRLETYMNNHGLQYINTNSNAAESTKKRILYTMYKADVLNNLASIDRALSDSNIDYVIMKGLPLYESIYGKYNTRISSDIDLLVDKCDILNSIKALTTIGYRYDNNTNVSEEIIIKDWHLAIGQQHIEPMIKPKSKDSFFSSCIELHHSIAPTYYADFGCKTDLYQLYAAKMINAREYRKYFGNIYPCLNPTHNFVMLILHYCTHIFHSCRGTIRSYRFVDMELNLLIEMAEYWNKFNDKINIIELCNIFQNSGRFLWMKFVDNLFSNVFNIHLLNGIPINESNDEYIIGQDSFRRILASLSKYAAYALIRDISGLIKLELKKAMICQNIYMDDYQSWHLDLQLLDGFKFNQRCIDIIHKYAQMWRQNDMLYISMPEQQLHIIINTLRKNHNINTTEKDIGEPGIYVSLNCCLDSKSAIQILYNVYAYKQNYIIQVLENDVYRKCTSEEATAFCVNGNVVIKIFDVQSLRDYDGVIIDLFASINSPYYHLLAPIYCKKYV